MEEKPRTVYHRGASDGLIMGAVLTAMFVLQAMGLRSALAMLWGQALMLAVPFVAYWLLRRGYREERCRSHFSTIWMHGISIFIFGALILGIVSYAYMRLVNPNFIATMVDMAAQMYYELGTPEAEHVADVLERMVDKGMLPTPISLAFSMMWLCSFAGTMLSLLLTVIVKYMSKKKY